MKNDHYVYLHKRKDNGIVFYIGHGRLNRAWTMRNRNTEWYATVDVALGFSVDYLADSLTKDEAVKTEGYLLENPQESWQLVNVASYSPVQDIRKETIEKYLQYDESSPSGLRWIRKFTNRIRKDLVAGTLVNGYWIVSINGKRYRAHRLICALHDRKLEQNFVVNHIDNNPKNNLISNLEVVSQANNSRKSKKNINPLAAGVNFSVVAGKYEYWTAYIYNLNSERFSKSFNCKKHGHQKAKELAGQWRLDQLRILNTKGAEYNI